MLVLVPVLSHHRRIAIRRRYRRRLLLCRLLCQPRLKRAQILMKRLKHFIQPDVAQ